MNTRLNRDDVKAIDETITCPAPTINLFNAEATLTRRAGTQTDAEINTAAQDALQAFSRGKTRLGEPWHQSEVVGALIGVSGVANVALGAGTTTDQASVPESTAYTIGTITLTVA